MVSAVRGALPGVVTQADHPLTSAPAEPIGPGDHVRGSGPEAIVWLDLACPVCAAAWQRIARLSVRLCVRHFPIASKRPRSPALHAATEAAGSQDPEAFWGLWESTLADQGRIDDPHLWQRARDLGLDLDRFERDRRSAETAARVRADLEGGIRSGVTGTPAAWAGGRLLGNDVVAALESFAAGADPDRSGTHL